MRKNHNFLFTNVSKSVILRKNGGAAMKYSWIDTELLQKPGVTKDLQAEWNWIRYHIGGKMFAAVCLDDATGKPVYITCKLDPAEGDFLRRQYKDIIPGYYMNKVHWNSVKADGNVPDALLREMLDSLSRPRDMEKSFLFAHIATKELDPDLGGQIKDALMTAIEKNEQYAFLREREDFQELVRS